MKITPAQFKNFCQSIPSHVQSILFYGDSEADIAPKLNNFVQQGLSQKISDFQVVECTPIIKKEVFLSDLLSSQSLFGPPQPIIIQKASDKIVPMIKDFLEEYQEKSPIIIVADSYLKPASKLRQLYEKENNLAIVACYARTPAEVTQEITAAFQSRGKSVDRMAAQVLAGKILNGSASMTSEVDKIVNYVGNDQEMIQLKDIEECVRGDAPEYEEKLYTAFLKMNWGQIPYLFLLASTDVDRSEVAIIRGLIAKLLQLKTLKGAVAEGKNFDQAVYMTSPPIFFQQKELMRTAMGLWHRDNINKALSKLVNLEQSVKLESSIGSQIMGMAFLKGV